MAPLLDAGLHKSEIRELSRLAGLPTWDRPASACLASRIPYGTAVTAAALAQVECAEAALRKLGFRQIRVRHFGELARVEISREELERATEASTAARICEAMCSVGYASVEIDPRGYRQGSLNEAIAPEAQESS